MKLTEKCLNDCESTVNAIKRLYKEYHLLGVTQSSVHITSDAFFETFEAYEITEYNRILNQVTCMRNGIMFYALVPVSKRG